MGGNPLENDKKRQKPYPGAGGPLCRWNGKGTGEILSTSKSFTMILVIATLILFYTLLFWNAARFNRLAECQQH